MLISRQNEIFTSWKLLKFSTFKFGVGYGLKIIPSEIISYLGTGEEIKIFILKKTFQLLKIFILSEKCLWVARMCFYKVKTLKIWNFHICSRYGPKIIPNEIISYLGTREEIKTFSLKEKISTFKNFHFERKVLISRQNEIFTRWKFSKFQTFQICVRYGLKSIPNEIISYYCRRRRDKNI